MPNTKVMAEVAEGEHAHLFAAFCLARGVTAEQMATELISERLTQLGEDPDVARSLRFLRREESGLRAVR